MVRTGNLSPLSGVNYSAGNSRDTIVWGTEKPLFFFAHPLIAFCWGQGYLWARRLPSYLLDGVSRDRLI